MNNLDQLLKEVLDENNAEFIYQHIRDLENDVTKHGRRWFWELLQNAKDAKKENELIEVETGYNNNRLTFKHSGKEFTNKEIIHLIYHGSTKKGDETKTGKFGTGFMTTHLLSKKVVIKGKLLNKENCFNFILDRTGENSNELQKTLEQSWENFKKSEVNCNSDEKYNTQFEYLINSSREHIVKNGFVNLKQSLPFVLSTNQEIGKIKINNNNDDYTISKETENDIDTIFKKIEIKVEEEEITIFKIEKELSIEIDYQEEDENKIVNETIKVSLCVELKGDYVNEIEENIPRFYYDFPLFTTEAFKFPAIINSLSFAPKIERDGIYLGHSNTYDVKKNKAVLSEAFKMYLQLVDKLIDMNCFNTHNLAALNKISIPEIDNDWNNSEIKKIILGLMEKEIIRNNKNALIKLSESIIPINVQSECHSEFWSLVEKIYPDRIVLKELHDDWIIILIKWKEFNLDKFNFETTLKDIAKIIADENDINNFSLKYFNENLNAAFNWLDYFYKLLNDNNNNILLEEISVIPNQKGKFIKKTSEIKIDIDVDEELKNILKLLGEDIRDILIDSNIIFFNDKNIFSTKTQQEVYEHTIDKVKGIDDSFIDEEFNASKKMLYWLLENNKIEQLEGFPVTVRLNEEKRNIYKLSTAQRLLVPVNLWKSGFNNHAEIFNSEFILNDEYEIILKDYIDILEEKGFIYAQPLYKEIQKFSMDDLQKVITEKVEDEFWMVDEENDTTFNIPEIIVSKIAYFVNPSEKSVLRNSRKSKKQTQNLLEFIFSCVLSDDDLIFNEQLICINDKEIPIYPSYWLAKLKSNQWVNTGKDKDEAPTSSNLSSYFEKSEILKLRLKDEKVAKLLNIIGVSVGDLTKNIYVKTDKEKLEWDKAYTSILSAGHDNDIKPDEIQNIFNDDRLVEEIRRKFKEKNTVKLNRDIGLTVEEIFKNIIDDELSSLNIKITKVDIGRDFDIEYDFIDSDSEKILSIESQDKRYSIELKSTKTDYTRMTKTQGLLSTNNEDNFSLCVLRHNYNIEDFKDEDGNIKSETKEIIKSNIRFVTNIGGKLVSQVQKVAELDNKVIETRVTSDEIDIDIDDGEIKYKIKSNVWVNSLTLNEFINYIKLKFNQ